MTGFSYTYTSIEDIFINIKTLADFSLTEYILLSWTLAILFVVVYTILPLLYIIHEHRLKEKEKSKRKKLLTQITLQKEIEDEIEQEIKMKEEAKIANNT